MAPTTEPATNVEPDPFAEFAGGGSVPARAAQLAEHRRLLAGRGSWRSTRSEREIILAHTHGQGGLASAGDRLAAHAQRDLDIAASSIRSGARESAALEAQARADAAVRAERHAKLAAQQEPDRVSPFRGVLGSGPGGWERLAAMAHAEQAQVEVGGERVSPHLDPDRDPLQPGEHRLA